MSQKKLPFSLDSLRVDYYFIEVYPGNQAGLALTKAKSLITAKKIIDNLQQNPDDIDKWGFLLPKNNGFLVAERLSLKDSGSRKKAISDYLRLIGKIHDETKMPIAEIQEYMAEPFKHIDKLNDYLGDISSTFTQLEETNDQTSLVTTLIKERLISTWNYEDTNALPETLFNEIVSYAENEQAGWKNNDTELNSDDDEVIEVSHDENEQFLGEPTVILSSDELDKLKV